MTGTNRSPFTSCDKGHDLTIDGAYVYDGGGRRSCRQCAIDSNKFRKDKRKKGSFA